MKKYIAIFVLVALVVSLTGCAAMKYKNAMSLYENGAYEEALVIFQELGDHENSAEMANACNYEIASEYLASGEYQKAADIFTALGDYKDSADKAKESAEMVVHEILAGTWNYTLSSGNITLTMTLKFNYGEISATVSTGTTSIPANEGDYTLDIETKTIYVNYDNGNSTSFNYSFEGGVYTVYTDSITLTKE